MLFIENYDAKSLDRSSVSMIDKYNGRLNIVGMLLTKLSALIDNLLSLIRDIRNTLGKCKQRVYDNLNQVRAVISGNRITGTEGTISAIEDALKAGDEAIAKAEARLEGVQKEMESNEEPGVETQPEGDCGEIPNEVPSKTTDCPFCTHGNETIICSGGQSFDGSDICSVCNHDGCAVDVSCNEPTTGGGYNPKCGLYYGGVPDPSEQIGQCSLQSIVDPECDEVYTKDTECSQYTCLHSDGCTQQIPDNCSYGCTHSTECSQSPMPHNCTYSCVDAGCNYQGNDCAYGTICNMSCDQPASEIEACGNCGQGYGCGDWSEFCGEVGGGSTSKGDEGCGDCGDCGNCGEGEGCGDWSEFCGE